MLIYLLWYWAQHLAVSKYLAFYYTLLLNPTLGTLCVLSTWLFLLAMSVLCVFAILDSFPFFPALMSLILCASYLCILCQTVCLPPAFLFPCEAARLALLAGEI